MSGSQQAATEPRTTVAIDPAAFERQVQSSLDHPIALAMAEPADWVHELFDVERAWVQRAIHRRVNEFSTGRVLARRAMQSLGVPPAPVARGEDRAPGWPAACIGSITHADGLVAAAVARRGTLLGLGIDLELADRVQSPLHARLFTDLEFGESVATRTLDLREATLRFSAKEAVYKAVNPLVRRFIGFREVEVRLACDRTRSGPDSPKRDPGRWGAQGSFAMRYVGDHAPNRVMEQGEGRYWCTGSHVFTLFVIS